MKRERLGSTSKSEAALADIRRKLEEDSLLNARNPKLTAWMKANVPKSHWAEEQALLKARNLKLTAWIKANLPKCHWAKFKKFVRTVEHLGDVDVRKAAEKSGVDEELLEKWLKTQTIFEKVEEFLIRGKQSRASRFLGYARFVGKSKFSKRSPPPGGDLHSDDSLDWDPRSSAKWAALNFKQAARFAECIGQALTIHRSGAVTSAKRFFIDLGKCLSYGTRGVRGINPQLWDSLDYNIADIILSHDPPLSDEEAVRILERRGFSEMTVKNLQTCVERFGTRKHRLIREAHVVCKNRKRR